jgi:putative phosphoribosyl transferase
MLFLDRQDAGRHLAFQLRQLSGGDVVVAGLPAGGVVVASEVAEELRAPLDIIVVRRLGVPFQPECAFGAIGEDGARVLNDNVIRQSGLTCAQITAVEAHEQTMLARRVEQLRADREPVPLTGKTVIIVDDGIATGATARAACAVARARGARRVVVAVPAGLVSGVAPLHRVADEVICPCTSAGFTAIGQWYADFCQITDEEVAALLDKAVQVDRRARAGARTADVAISCGVRLAGTLVIPECATGLVVFAHGSGSSRCSPRNQSLAAALNRAGLGTLLTDLLTADEELSHGYVFNIAHLSSRLARVTSWLRGQPGTDGLPIGYFGASTGAAAALWAAADPELNIAAVVARGGRPDLAGPRLAAVRAPTLLVVGESDEEGLALNQSARQQLTCENQLTVIPGATGLLGEPDTLKQTGNLAADWFTGHLHDG